MCVCVCVCVFVCVHAWGVLPFVPMCVSTQGEFKVKEERRDGGKEREQVGKGKERCNKRTRKADH